MAESSGPRDLKDRVKQMVENSTVAVVDGVVDHLVAEEVDKRKKLILKGLADLSKLEGELVRIKGEKRFDLAGTVVSETFGPKEKQEREKLAQRITKVSGAIEQAMKGDYNKLNGLFQQGGEKPAAEGEEQPE